jgi:hypothetical protein
MGADPVLITGGTASIRSIGVEDLDVVTDSPCGF